MTKLTWTDERLYERGVDRGVLYPLTGPGEAWNGLISVRETPEDFGVDFRYIDGVKVAQHRRPGEFLGTIDAFTYPDSFYQDSLTQRRASTFGLSYRTTGGDNYRIHLVYNVVVQPSRTKFQQRDPSNFSWPFTTMPVDTPFAKKTSHLILDTRLAYSWTVQALEDVLYGTDSTDPRLPLPQEVWDIVEENSIVIVTDHGDGTFTVTGPDDVITDLGSNEFEITWPSVINISVDNYQISSL
jgi:hypothetical protein